MTVDRQQYLNEAASELFDYVDNVWIIKDISDTINKKFGIASPYLNFRDALFHYNKMYEADCKADDFSFIQQYACIEEHLNRGLKDFAIHLCANFYTRILHQLMETKAMSVTAKNHSRLRHIYHEIKNLVTVIRLEGQTLQHFNNHRIVWLSDMVAAIKDFDDLMAEDRALKQLYVRFTNDMFRKTGA